MTQLAPNRHNANTRKVLEATPVQDLLDALDYPQRRYVLQRTIGMMGPSAAAQDAGLKTPPTSRAVNAALSAVRVELAKDLDISLDDIKRGFMTAINLAESIGEPGHMINGWDKIAKLLGHHDSDNKPSLVIHGDVTIADMRSMSNAQLDQLIKEGEQSILEGEGQVVRRE